METIPFKQVEIVSNEYVYGLLITITIVAVIATILINILKKKGLFKFSGKVESGIKILHRCQVSRNTQLYYIEVDGQQILLAESVRNIAFSQFDKVTTHLFEKSSLDFCTTESKSENKDMNSERN